MGIIAVGMVAALGAFFVGAHALSALGVTPPSGDQIEFTWLLVGNISSLMGAAAVGFFGLRVGKTSVVSAMLVWGVSTGLIMLALQNPMNQPAQYVQMSLVPG